MIVTGAFVPAQVALGPLFTMMESWGQLNSRVGIILPYLAFGIPFETFFLYNFFSSIPRDVDEAARIAGITPAALSALHFALIRAAA